MINKLTQEIVDYMTNGWTSRERKTEWELFKEEEIKIDYPEIYKLIKKIKKLDK